MGERAPQTTTKGERQCKGQEEYSITSIVVTSFYLASALYSKDEWCIKIGLGCIGSFFSYFEYSDI